MTKDEPDDRSGCPPLTPDLVELASAQLSLGSALTHLARACAKIAPGNAAALDELDKCQTELKDFLDIASGFIKRLPE